MEYRFDLELFLINLCMNTNLTNNQCEFHDCISVQKLSFEIRLQYNWYDKWKENRLQLLRFVEKLCTITKIERQKEITIEFKPLFAMAYSEKLTANSNKIPLHLVLLKTVHCTPNRKSFYQKKIHSVSHIISNLYSLRKKNKSIFIIYSTVLFACGSVRLF